MPTLPLVLLLLHAVKAQPSVPVPSSLVGYWPFDVDVDDVRNALVGTIINGDMLGDLSGDAQVSSECARRGRAGLKLTGGYVDYGKADVLNFHNMDEVTITMWIKGTGHTQPTTYWNPISWHHSSSIGLVWQGSGAGTLAAGATTTQARFNGATLSGSGSTAWYHLAFVRSAAGSAAFVNGVQVDTGKVPSSPIKMCGIDGTSCPMEDGTWRVWIGGDPHYRRFHGCIDEVKVFSKRPSPDEIDAFGMQGHWHPVAFFTN